MITVDDLRKVYGEFVAVHGSTFSVEPGEIFGVVAPNGAGKTTTPAARTVPATTATAEAAPPGATGTGMATARGAPTAASRVPDLGGAAGPLFGDLRDGDADRAHLAADAGGA